MNRFRHHEHHRTHHVGWLRAAVLGANDGIVSTASLVLGVAAAHQSQSSILIAGVAGLIAGAMSMATGEYVSVYSQADTETADLQRERRELATNQFAEQSELKAIYESRGLDSALAAKVAAQLMAHDALGAHARDELGISDSMRARPLQAAAASAASFAAGAIVPLIVAVVIPSERLIAAVALTSLVLLAILGALAAHAGGASKAKGATRVAVWSALAMALTMGAGTLFGAAG